MKQALTPHQVATAKSYRQAVAEASKRLDAFYIALNMTKDMRPHKIASSEEPYSIVMRVNEMTKNAFENMELWRVQYEKCMGSKNSSARVVREIEKSVRDVRRKLQLVQKTQLSYCKHFLDTGETHFINIDYLEDPSLSEVDFENERTMLNMVLLSAANTHRRRARRVSQGLPFESAPVGVKTCVYGSEAMKRSTDRNMRVISASRRTLDILFEDLINIGIGTYTVKEVFQKKLGKNLLQVVDAASAAYRNLQQLQQSCNHCSQQALDAMLMLDVYLERVARMAEKIDNWRIMQTFDFEFDRARGFRLAC